MLGSGHAAMARIHSEAFRQKKELAKQDEVGHQDIHEILFHEQSHRKLDDDSGKSPDQEKGAAGYPLMTNQESHT